jgi:hypothetical protein
VSQPSENWTVPHKVIPEYVTSFSFPDFGEQEKASKTMAINHAKYNLLVPDTSETGGLLLGVHIGF